MAQKRHSPAEMPPSPANRDERGLDHVIPHNQLISPASIVVTGGAVLRSDTAMSRNSITPKTVVPVLPNRFAPKRTYQDGSRSPPKGHAERNDSHDRSGCGPAGPCPTSEITATQSRMLSISYQSGSQRNRRMARMTQTEMSARE